MIETPTIYPRFRSYYRSLVPLFEKPKVAAYTMLVLSFFTVAIFGSFAIRPTLATIFQLKKKIDDQQTVYTRMEDKIAKLREAEVEYKNITPDLEAIFGALPTKPQAADLLGKLNRTLAENNIDITVLQFSSIDLVGAVPIPSPTMIGFTLSANASYDDALSFIDLLSRMDRVVAIDSVSISRQSTDKNVVSNVLTLSIRGAAYVLGENTNVATNSGIQTSSPNESL